MGRRDVTRRLGGALDGAIAGAGRIVTLAGEPGIGKTRVAAELATRARLRGADVAWGRCFEGEGAPLYWPWSLVLRDALASRGKAAVRRLLGSGLSAVAKVIPSVGEAFPGLPQSTSGRRSPMARFRVFEAVSGLIRKAAAARPIMIVLDDLQWADESSLQLLSFICRDVAGSRVLLVAAYRDAEVRRRHLVEGTLGDLARERCHEHIALRPLRLQEVRRYLAVACGADVAERSSEAVLARTDGNPLLVAKLAEFLVNADGSAGGAELASSLPHGLRQIVARRIDGLSAKCRMLVAAAACIGHEFSDDLVARCVPGGQDAFPKLLDEAEASGIIQAMPGGVGGHRFEHALTREVVLALLPAGDRTRMHARIAQAMELGYGERVDEHARELVEQLERARGACGTDKLLRYLARAAEQAESRYAWEEAMDLYARAVALSDDGPEDEQTADLFFGLGRAQSALYDNGAARSCLRAFAIYERLGRSKRAVAVAVHGLHSEAVQEVDVLRMHEHALALAEADSVDQAAVMAAHAMLASVPIGAEERGRRLSSALGVARRKGDTGLEIDILYLLFLFKCRTLDHIAAATHATEMRKLALREGDLYAQCRAIFATCTVEEMCGAPLEQYNGAVEEFFRLAERLRDRMWLVAACKARSRVAGFRAQWPCAKEFNAMQRSYLPSGSEDVWVLAHQAFFACQTADLGQADEALEQAVQTAERCSPRYHRPAVAHYVTWIALMSGRSAFLAEAERFAREALADSLTSPEGRLYALAAQADLAVIRSDSAAAEVCYQALMAVASTNLYARLEGRLGLTARVAGRREEAVRHLRDSVDLSARLGCESFRMWNLYYLAETLIERSAPGDAKEAERLLADLLEGASRTGSVLVERRGRALLDRLRGPVRPDRLTRREIQVLRCMATGKTNKEIGRDLFISTTTVNAHVRSILEKIGAANRAEAASYATRSGLTSEPPMCGSQG